VLVVLATVGNLRVERLYSPGFVRTLGRSNLWLQVAVKLFGVDLEPLTARAEVAQVQVNRDGFRQDEVLRAA
jgi:hypothetical protein